MALDSLGIPNGVNLSPRIVVFGVGGGGGNAIRTMLTNGLEGVEFIAANTDAQALEFIEGEIDRVQLGETITQGLGAGADPEIGRKAAEESREIIKEKLKDVHLCFLTAGMGGGSGTGACPIIAEIANELGVMTVGVVTKPFHFEGDRRMEVALKGLEELQKAVNTLLVIPNQNLFSISKQETETKDAFRKVDEVLYHGVKSITDLMIKPGLINLDFADVRSVLKYPGRAIMGVGQAEGEDRGKKAAEMAMESKLIEDTDLQNAKAVLINIVGGDDQKLFDLSQASDTIKSAVPRKTHVIVGMSQDPAFNGIASVSLVATGLGIENEEEFSELEPTIVPNHFEDEDGFRNNALPEDFLHSDAEEIVSLSGDEENSSNVPSVMNGVGIADESFEKKAPLMSFAAPKMSNNESSEGEKIELPVTNVGYKEVMGSLNSEEPVEEDEEQINVMETIEPPKKGSFQLFNFIDRRKKSKIDKSKIPAFIRRQAN